MNIKSSVNRITGLFCVKNMSVRIRSFYFRSYYHTTVRRQCVMKYFTDGETEHTDMQMKNDQNNKNTQNKNNQNNQNTNQNRSNQPENKNSQNKK